MLNKGCKIDKKVLVLCTGNSCRSIIAEGLINKYIDGVEAQSSGVKASGRVNPYAKKALELDGSWDDKYHCKVIDEIIDTKFDLVVTVCDNAKESCPIFSHSKVIHIGFEDPDGKEFEEFEKTLKCIKNELIPKVKKELGC
ncbi:MAG: arsenate reductase ArsC [Sulfurimonas sp.]|nr:arsenate reductase ArsC [Sulfurimonas sp.]